MWLLSIHCRWLVAESLFFFPHRLAILFLELAKDTAGNLRERILSGIKDRSVFEPFAQCQSNARPTLYLHVSGKIICELISFFPQADDTSCHTSPQNFYTAGKINPCQDRGTCNIVFHCQTCFKSQQMAWNVLLW